MGSFMDEQIIEYGLIGDSTVSLSSNLDDMIKGFQANQDHDINSTWPLAADPDHYLLQSTAHDHDQAVNPADQDLQVPWRWAQYDHYQTAEEGSCTADHHHHRMREDDRTEEELEPYKEMIYRVASMQPINDVVGAANVIQGKPYRRNVRISEDPQSVAARQRRDRISQKIRILRSLVPGGSHMDTASMLDEAASYIKYLKRQIRLLNRLYHHHPPPVFASDGSPTSNYPTFQVPK